MTAMPTYASSAAAQRWRDISQKLDGADRGDEVRQEGDQVIGGPASLFFLSLHFQARAGQTVKSTNY